MNVLICNPNFKSHEIYLPYFWGRIKEYCEFQDNRDFSKVNFLYPIFTGGVAVNEYYKITDKYNFKEIDLLFISCYVWNWKLNLKIAEVARSQNPNIVIVAGGPSALYKPWQDVHLFEVCDYVTPGEGEKISADIIYTVMTGGDLTKIPYLVNPKEPKDVRIPRQNLSNFKSPYVEYKNDYLKFVNDVRAENSSATVLVMWETNRGCPYKCSFCDWGGTTNSKLKKYDEQMIKDEIDVICRDIRPSLIFNLDANFGILAKDIEYAQYLADSRMKYGYPTHGLYFSPAKNHKDNVNKIMKIFHDNYLLPFTQLSFQHTDVEVLEAIDRDNIKLENFAETMKESFELSIPMTATIILGNPGDTPAKWKNVLDEMMNSRFPDIRVHDFMLLPNAPAADPSYREKYGITGMIRKHMGEEFGTLNLKTNSFDAEYILETKTFNKNDYIQMQIDSATVLGYHILNFTQFISLYLKYYHNVSFIKFYDDFRELPTVQGHVKDLKAGLEDWVEGRTLYKYIPYRKTNLSPDVYLKARAVYDINKIKSELTEMLETKYNLDSELVNDLIKFQYRTIVGPWKQVDVTINHNIPEIIRKILKMPPMEETVDLPLKKERNLLRSNQNQVGLYNKLLRKIPINNDGDFDNWLQSRIHTGGNMRTAVNCYNQVLGL